MNVAAARLAAAAGVPVFMDVGGTDAPLDEANVGRFCDVVRELSLQTQFIIITHNKRTMETADRLYGVTMQQRGVSKLVSVNLRRSVEEARLN